MHKNNTHTNYFSKISQINRSFYIISFFFFLRVAKHENENFDILLDVFVYKQRLRISFEAYLLEANLRGRETGRNVFVIAGALGCGAWSLMRKHQTRIHLEVYREILQVFEYLLTHQSFVQFTLGRIDITRHVFTEFLQK